MPYQGSTSQKKTATFPLPPPMPLLPCRNIGGDGGDNDNDGDRGNDDNDDGGGDEDNGCNSKCGWHRQQSTQSGNGRNGGGFVGLALVSLVKQVVVCRSTNSYVRTYT
jgi:hypothetical protein